MPAGIASTTQSLQYLRHLALPKSTPVRCLSMTSRSVASCGSSTCNKQMQKEGIVEGEHWKRIVEVILKHIFICQGSARTGRGRTLLHVPDHACITYMSECFMVHVHPVEPLLDFRESGLAAARMHLLTKRLPLHCVQPYAGGACAGSI